MRAIMVMYDTLRLDVLPHYGGHEIELPNFRRLARRTVAFENNYVCSLPCMPARREIHTGRANFLHRSWGPLEPFDDSMPELLKRSGVYTHLVTDHYHYLEDGGCTYHSRYNTWDCIRGQEGDPWYGSAEPRTLSPHTFPLKPEMSESFRQHLIQLGGQDVINRRLLHSERDYPMHHTFDGGVDFIERNFPYDNWFLQVETFDPHEPFDVPDPYLRKLLDPDTMSQLDWPPYAPVQEDPEIVDQVRKKYLTLVAFCDAQLGRVLDAMDAHDMWKDTLLIVNTDHGFMLSEHDWWGKMAMPDYNEIAHTPLFIWDPRLQKANETRSALVQTIDLAPTLLEFFGVPVPADMRGSSLRPVLERDEPIREYGIFGAFGSVLNITDGRYVYMLAPVDYEAEQYEYTLMPTHMRARFSPAELRTATLFPDLPFAKGAPVLRIPASAAANTGATSSKLKAGTSLLFDLQADPGQNVPIRDEAVTARLRQALRAELARNDAPEELYRRYGLAD